jgi:hypothetical protein
VDPLTLAGQNLNVLFHNNKKGKTVLDSRWIQKCVDAGKILAYKFQWAGCKLTGKERSVSAFMQLPATESSVGMNTWRGDKKKLLLRRIIRRYLL